VREEAIAMFARPMFWPIIVVLAVTASACRAPEAASPALEYVLVLTEEGETRTVRLEVRNPRPRVARLEFPSSQRHDFVIRQEGREVWRWSEGMAFLTVMVEDTLGPGAAESYEEVLPPLPAGTYVVEAFFLADRDRGAVASRTFTVR